MGIPIMNTKHIETVSAKGKEAEARRKMVLSKFRVHATLIMLCTFLALFLNEEHVHVASVKREYFFVAFFVLALIDYIWLRWRYRN